MTSPSDAPPPPPREIDLGAKPLPLTIDMPAVPDAAAAQAAAQAPARPRSRAGVVRWLVRVGIALAVLGGLLAVAVFWLLPWYVRRACIERAAEHGIALQVDDASLDTSGFRLLGVRATAAAVPDARAQAPEIAVTMAGLQPDVLTVKRAEITLKGRWSTLEAAVTKWRASPTGGQGGSWAPSSFVVDESRIVWQSPVGDAVRLDAANVHFGVTWRAAGSEVHARSDKVSLAVPGGTLGPWRVDLDRTPGSRRVRLALDPGVPDSCTVLVVGNDERFTSLDASVPRSPLARLGIPPAVLGLKGNALQVQLDAHYASLGPQRGDATAKGGLYSIEAGLPRPLDVSWELTATGDPRTGLDVKKGRLAAGPLVGTVTGMLKPFDDGFRIDLAWKADPVPCSAFEAPASAGQPFDIAFQLRKLAEATGVAKVEGTVGARGTLAFDTRDLSTAHAEFAPEVRCQVALFGH